MLLYVKVTQSVLRFLFLNAGKAKRVHYALYIFCSRSVPAGAASVKPANQQVLCDCQDVKRLHFQNNISKIITDKWMHLLLGYFQTQIVQNS